MFFQLILSLCHYILVQTKAHGRTTELFIKQILRHPAPDVSELHNSLEDRFHTHSDSLRVSLVVVAVVALALFWHESSFQCKVLL